MPVTFPQGDPRKKLPAYRDKVLRGVHQGVRTICLMSKGLATKTVTDIGKVDRGVLRGSIDFRVEVVPGKFYRGIVFAGAEHGVWVEYGKQGKLADPRTDKIHGARTGLPPLKVIAEWVGRNFRKLSGIARTKSGKAKKPGPDEEKRIAQAIRWHIYNYGIKPAPFMTPTFLRLSPQFRNILNDAVARSTGAGGSNP